MYLVLLHSIICCINFSALYYLLLLLPIIYNIACVNNTSPSCSVVEIFEFLSGFMEVSFIEMICSDQSAYTYNRGPSKVCGHVPAILRNVVGKLDGLYLQVTSEKRGPYANSRSRPI